MNIVVLKVFTYHIWYNDFLHFIVSSCVDINSPNPDQSLYHFPVVAVGTITRQLR